MQSLVGLAVQANAGYARKGELNQCGFDDSNEMSQKYTRWELGRARAIISETSSLKTSSGFSGLTFCVPSTGHLYFVKTSDT